MLTSESCDMPSQLSPKGGEGARPPPQLLLLLLPLGAVMLRSSMSVIWISCHVLQWLLSVSGCVKRALDDFENTLLQRPYDSPMQEP